MGSTGDTGSPGGLVVGESLEHYGVKGMRWGVRKRRTPDESSSADAHRVYGHKQAVKSGGTNALSTKELQELVTRMNLEQQYAKLQPPSKGSKIAKGTTKVVGQVLGNIGKQQATRIGNEIAAPYMDQIAAQLKKAATS